MLEKLKKIPHPGLRNVKTCIAVVIIIIIYKTIGRNGVILALVAAILCMQDSVDKSINLGIARIKGTLLGGLLGVCFTLLHLDQLNLLLFLVCIFFSVMIFIFICNLIGAKSSILIGCVVFLMTVLESTDYSPITHAINRTVDTLVGIVVAFIINQLIFRPRPERYRGQASINPFFNYDVKRLGHQKLMGWHNKDTTELYIYPEDELAEDRRFDFRLSHTVVKMEKNAFYKFPGYKRQVMLLDGEMQLTHSFNGEPHHSINLSQYDVDCFRGEWDTSCKGLCTDLCLMTKEGYTGNMEPVYAPDIFSLKNDHFEGVYILEDNTKITFTYEGRNQRETLNRGDFFFVGWYTNGSSDYTVSFSVNNPIDTGTVAAIRISCSKEDEHQNL